MNTVTFHIKDMCCARCISEVKRIFESAGLYSLKLKLGEVVVNSSITKAVHNKVVKDLEANGFSIVSSIDDQIIVNIQALLIFYLDEYQIENVSLFTISAFLTKQLDKSYSQLSRIFKQGTNNTIEKYFIQLKIEKAKELLILNQIDIAGIGYLLGFSTSQNFSTHFKRETGKTPVEYRKNPKPKRIQLPKLI